MKDMPFSMRLRARMSRDTIAVPSIKDCDSSWGIISDRGVVRKFARKDTADMVIIAFTKK